MLFTLQNINKRYQFLTVMNQSYNNRHYDEYAKCKLEDSFSYDDYYYTNDLIKEFIDNEYRFIKADNKNTSFQKLDKIIKDNNL